MLERLSADQVKRVAELAARAAAVRDRLINKIQSADLKDQLRRRGDLNPTDLDSLQILDSVGSPDYAALKEAIGELSADQRVELKAVALIGRGDFSAGQWEQAVDAARALPQGGDVDYLAEKAPLREYLMKGLYELRLG